MGSFLDLNTYSQTTFTFDDQRTPGPRINMVSQVDLANTATSNTFTIERGGVEIIEIVRASDANIEFEIDVSAVPGTTVDFGTLPAGLTTTSIAGKYRVGYISTTEEWDSIKDPTVTVPSIFQGSFFYTVSIKWVDSTGIRTFSYRVGEFVPVSLLSADFGVSAAGAQLKGSVIDLDGGFTLSAVPSLATIEPVFTMSVTAESITFWSGAAQTFTYDAGESVSVTAPLIDYELSESYELTITPSNTDGVSSFTSSGSGGTTSFNSTTKVYTITGTGTEINSHLSALTFNSTSFAIDQTFTYRAENSTDANAFYTNIQTVDCNDNDLFTFPTTTEYTYTADTAFLLDGLGTVDDSLVNIPRTVSVTNGGAVTFSSAEKKFGSHSAEFDGTLNSFIDCNEPILNATGGFTIEAWIRKPSTGGRAKIFQQDAVNINTGDLEFFLNDATNKITFSLYAEDGGPSRVYLESGTISADTWYHVAVERNNTDYNLYVNGSRVDQDTTTGGISINQTDAFIGDGTSDDPFYLDDVRISDTPRYQSAAFITVPTAPFLNDSNTLLLLHFDNDLTDDDGDNNYNYYVEISDGSITNTEITPTATTDRFTTRELTVENTTTGGPFGAGTAQSTTANYFENGLIPEYGDWTLEFWVAEPGSNGYNEAEVWRQDITYLQHSLLNTDVTFVYSATDSLTTTWASHGTVTGWCHFAIQRTGDQITLHRNGTLVDYDSLSRYTSWPQDNFEIANNITNYSPLSVSKSHDGVGEMRFSTTALYGTSGFTVSTSAMQNVLTTTHLNHWDGTGDDTGLDGTVSGIKTVGTKAELNAALDAFQLTPPSGNPDIDILYTLESEDGRSLTYGPFTAST